MATQVQNYGLAPEGWDDCAICFDVKNEELIGHQPQVSEDATEAVFHKYHTSCMNEWLRTSMTCPECRTPLASREVNQIQNPLLQLELAIPGALTSPKAYIKDIADNLPLTAGLSSAFVAGEFLGKGVVPLNPLVIFLGTGVGFAASSLIRNHTGEPPVRGAESEYQRIQNVVQSKPFLGAMAVAGMIGAFAVFGTALTSTLPIVLGGMAAHYGIEKLEESDMISGEAKSQMQKATSIFTAAYGMMSPLRSLVSIGLGAAAGAIAENASASARVEQQEI